MVQPTLLPLVTSLDRSQKTSNSHLERNRTQSNGLILNQPSDTSSDRLNHLLSTTTTQSTTTDVTTLKSPVSSSSLSPINDLTICTSPESISPITKSHSPMIHPSSSITQNHQNQPFSSSTSHLQSILTPFTSSCSACGSSHSASRNVSDTTASFNNSIHSLLTQPALVTLAQLAPAQLLSVSSLNQLAGTSDPFQVSHDSQALRIRESQPSNYLSRNGWARLEDGDDDYFSTSQSSHPQLPGTMELLSSSTIALPITSITGIWRLLNCINWINFKQVQMISNPATSHTSQNSCLNDPPTVRSTGNRRASDHLVRTFDLANTLQHVGDILSAISSESDVEIVFYHIFYSPAVERSESSALQSHLNLSRSFSEGVSTHLSLSPVTSPESGKLDSFSNCNQEAPSTFLGAGADGEGGLREVYVKADEQGLIIGLTCLLRQVISRAKHSSTIEVGLHLTPLYRSENEIPKVRGNSCSTNEESPVCGADDGQLNGPSSWKCIFDVSLTPPAQSYTNNPNPDVVNLTTLLISGTMADKQTPKTLARIRMSNNLTSELPPCPEESLPKLIFQNFLGMRLTTGRKTPGGHSWKVTGTFESGDSGEIEDGSKGILQTKPADQTKTHISAVSQSSREPTADELTLFAETVLPGKKVTLFAAEQSIFAKHITTYLTSWNMDVSHMPYKLEDRKKDENLKRLPARDVLQQASQKISGELNMSSNHLTPSLTSSNLAPSEGGSKRNKSFIIIDDDINTLKAEVLRLVSLPPATFNLPSNLLQSKTQQQSSQRPSLSRRTKSSNHIDSVEGSKRASTSIIYFTSISRFRQVQDVIRNRLTATQWYFIPEILVIPKPIGPRRILTALHSAINRPLIEPHFAPIATSPSGPGTPQHLGSAHQSMGNSPLGRTSPSLTHLGVLDFDSAVTSHQMKNDHQLGEAPPGETPSIVSLPSQSGSTPPGLRTPGTAPGTPGFPSPALLSNEALEYFSKAASENGGSSSTGVVLQSPDGRPQAMFFHHSVSSHRSGSGQVTLHNNAHHHLSQSTSGIPGTLTRNGSGRFKPENRSNLSKPMVREFISNESNSEPKSLAQQVMSSTSNDHVHPIAQRPQLSSGTNSGDNSESDKSIQRSSARKSSLNSSPNDNPLPHAMDLDKFEAISPSTPTVAIGSTVFTSVLSQYQAPIVSPPLAATTPTLSGLTTTSTSPIAATSNLSQLSREQQMILLNPRPMPMLRMPSVPASLPSSISVTLPSPRRPLISASHSTIPPNIIKSRPQNSPPLQSHKSPGMIEGGVKSEISKSPANSSLVMGAGNLQRARSISVQTNRRRTSMGDSIGINRISRKKSSRKPATVVPPINVLIVEDNRINQTILATFLTKKSVKFDVAMNGQEAVDKWRNGSFHLVLMDLQLPVKDGIEATKEIRESERAVNINAFANTPPAAAGNSPPSLSNPPFCGPTPHKVSVIIVALTASSLDVDREVALAAGCNDFLTKPVSLAWLEKKLLEWGSMAWLSGFSRLMPPNGSLNKSLPTPLSLPQPMECVMNFTGSAAQKKAWDVARHLHIKFDKNLAIQDGQTDLSQTSINENVSNSRRSQAQTKCMNDGKDQESSPASVSEESAGYDKSNDLGKEDENRPMISLQAPTPEKSGALKLLEVGEEDLSNPILEEEAEKGAVESNSKKVEDGKINSVLSPPSSLNSANASL
ncbi:hypothetical protein BY996DRAFT_8695796 [Phakopsora pachyrhizi]|nr:hypothetical protein BY996DRAFT_8695796 [Phakopsora pachyrhizi]